MQRLRDFLKGPHVTADMQLSDPSWVDRASLPKTHGWYYITTDTPLEVLSSQALWQADYVKKKSGIASPVRNYNLSARSLRHCEALAPFLNTEHVYSGFASDLRLRAKEHTLPDPGTGALALGRYPALARYMWRFSYCTLADFMPDCPSPTFMLRLGEQLWRAENGWPVLCAA